MDLWLIGNRVSQVQFLESILDAVLPGVSYRLNETSHPHTRNGLEIEVLVDGKWIEVGEWGEVHLDLLRSHSSGLASGWGLVSFGNAGKGNR
ncbi:MULTISPECIES: hypothetical protein [Fischerella]|nr:MULTISPECIES: hypothetical protein [Fischerella]